MTNEEFLRLTTLYLEDVISRSDQQLLNQALANSPDRVRQFNDLRILTGLIHEHGQTINQGHSTTTIPVRSATSYTSAVRPHSESLPHIQPTRRIAGITFAVLVTAASLLFVISRPDHENTQIQPIIKIATLAYTSHAGWGNRDRLLGDPIGRGKIHLKVGLARLDFNNGATVTLQGPAELEVLSANQTRLVSGILTASIPESAVGFEVVTPSMDVVDLGTAFGVAVGLDGETDVCVFEGEVEVRQSGDETQDSTRLLSEGSAVRWNPQAKVIDPIDFHTNRYEDGWPVTSGVLQATGLIKFVAPGPDFVPGRYEDNERVLVFQEQTNVALQQDLMVDCIDPGRYQRIHGNESYRIQAGICVRSYLLQLDPVGRLTKDATNKPRVMGQVTFDRPIVGLIARSSKLNATDDLLGHPRGDYVKTRRGIEPPRPKDREHAERDVVILSENRRTLSVDLSAGTAIDQIRVIVEETR